MTTALPDRYGERRRTGTATAAFTTEHTEITENDNGELGGRHGLAFPLT